MDQELAKCVAVMAEIHTNSQGVAGCRESTYPTLCVGGGVGGGGGHILGRHPL